MDHPEPRDMRRPHEPGRVLVATDHGWLSARLPAAERPPSEYAFANQFLFRKRHRYRIVTAPFPHLIGITYDGQRHALPLAPMDPAAADSLLNTYDCLYPFGAEGIALADMLGLVCRYEPADSDYIYDAVRMTALDGAKTRRSQARTYAIEQRPTFYPLSPETMDEMQHVLAGWLADIDRDAAATDFAECREAISMAIALDLAGALIRTGTGEPVAFMLASRRGDGEHVVHFAKGRRAHSSAYPWMFARYAAVSGATRLNFEQDLGNPGFAQSKRSYAPIELRPKYRLMRS